MRKSRAHGVAKSLGLVNIYSRQEPDTRSCRTMTKIGFLPSLRFRSVKLPGVMTSVRICPQLEVWTPTEQFHSS